MIKWFVYCDIDMSQAVNAPYTIKMLKRTDGIWWDMGEKKWFEGYIYAFLVRDSKNWEWLFNVKIEKNFRKAIVHPVAMSKPNDRIRRQILSKTIVFRLSNDKQYLCHPIGLAYVNERERLHYKRLSNQLAIPSGLQRLADRIDRYGNFINVRSGIKDKLCVAIRIKKQKPDEIAKRLLEVFILEKIEFL